MSDHRAILLIHCPDQRGLVSVITRFLWDHNANIVDLDEHADTDLGVFFCRVEWELAGFNFEEEQIGEAFREQIAEKYGMTWELHFTSKPTQIALFASKSTHCVYDVVFRAQQSDWPFRIGLIVANHPEMEEIARRFEIPFHHFEVSAADKAQVEQSQLQLLQEYDVDLIVLARYMQILSDDFVSHYPNRIINIHHSFLPAFPGARPYHQAYARGVKIIGATSHYVTADLDAGPIIEQDVVKISHKDDVPDLVRKGQDLEKIVLSRAIWSHIHHKVLPYGNKTIIFD